MKAVFLREADRAMDLMSDRRAHLHRAVGAQFRCGNFEPGIPALKRLCRTDGCAIRGSRLAGESGERLLHGLELAERPAELSPLVDIADRQRERRIERAGDLRRARAAGLSMIPTSTGAAKAIGLVMPELKGKLDGYAMRVPTADVSVVDLSVKLRKSTDADAINAAMKAAADGPLKGILQDCDKPLVSVDFLGNQHSSILDAPSTKVMEGNFAKLLAWYDNEVGYATRVVDLVQKMAQ